MPSPSKPYKSKVTLVSSGIMLVGTVLCVLALILGFGWAALQWYGVLALILVLVLTGAASVESWRNTRGR